MIRYFSTTVLLFLVFIQSCIIIYFGSEILVNKFILPQENYDNQQRESVNVIVANRSSFTGCISTYGRVRSKRNCSIILPNLGNHEVIVYKIHFKPGEYVLKDQQLVTLYCEELEYKLKAAKTDCERSNEKLAKLLRTPVHVSNYEQKAAELDVAKAESEYLALKSFMNALNIKAPFEGYIGITDIVQGSRVVRDKHITDIISSEDLIVEFHIEPEQVVHVATGHHVVVSTLDSSHHSTGQIIGVNPYIDESTSKIKVIAKLLEEPLEDDGKVIFKHNLNVKILIDKTTIQNVYVVPVNVIVKEGNKTYVAKIERGYNGYETKMVAVDIVDTKLDTCCIVGAIEDGDFIVCEGSKSDGGRVYVREILD